MLVGVHDGVPNPTAGALSVSAGLLITIFAGLVTCYPVLRMGVPEHSPWRSSPRRSLRDSLNDSSRQHLAKRGERTPPGSTSRSSSRPARTLARSARPWLRPPRRRPPRAHSVASPKWLRRRRQAGRHGHGREGIMQHAGRQESTQHRYLGARHDQDGRWGSRQGSLLDGEHQYHVTNRLPGTVRENHPAG